MANRYRLPLFSARISTPAGGNLEAATDGWFYPRTIAEEQALLDAGALLDDTANPSSNFPLTAESIQTPAGSAAVAAALGGAVFGETLGTEAGIRAAAAIASAAGGGIVQLQPKTYTITATLPLLTGVTYRGSGYLMSGYGVLSGGTIIQGDGTFPIFSAAATDFGALPGSLAGTRTELVLRCGVKDMALKNGTYGIKCGALYKAGVYWGDFDNLYISGMTQWGVWFENFIECRFSRFKTETTNGVGHMWFGDSTGTWWNHGNSTVQQLLCEVGGAYTRNIVFMARGASSAMNDLTVTDIQSNGHGGRFTDSTAAFSNSVPDITVADASKWPVDFPVCVEANVYGFVAYTTYFVVSSNTSTNKIQLSSFMGGAAITPSGSGTATLVGYGWPGLEIVGYGDSSNNTIQSSQFFGVDMESWSVAMRVLQNASVTAAWGTVNSTQGTQCANTLTCRKAYGAFSASGIEIPDFDWSSHAGFISMGYTLNAGATLPTAGGNGQMPQGMVRTTGAGGGEVGLYLGTSKGGSNKVTLLPVNAPAQSHIYPRNPLSQRVQTSTSTSLNLNGSHLGAIAFTGGSAATWNLPTLSGNQGGDANTYLGGVYEIANCGTANMTVNTAASQLFNNQATKSTVTLTPGQSFTIRAQVTGSTFFWQVVGNNGVTI